MPRRSRDKTEKFLPNTPTASLSQPSLFFGNSEPKEPIGEPPEIYEDPITEEELENVSSEAMAENRNDRREDERIEGAFPIRETNGDMKIKKHKSLSFTSLPWIDY